jgi:Ner family transcriptional regulator
LANRVWHPEDIKAAVRKTGTTLSRLALDSGLWDSACRQALHGPQYQGEQAIARHLGIPAQELWPSRYDSDGTPKHARARSQHRAPRERGQRLSAKVA